MFQKIKNEIKIHKKNLKNGRQAKKEVSFNFEDKVNSSKHKTRVRKLKKSGFNQSSKDIVEMIIYRTFSLFNYYISVSNLFLIQFIDENFFHDDDEFD